ncbi:hypothetical protein ACWC10_04625 [Streptomyces sp. NPDC001595]|uniref:hypothetical protein n=1 Tax=Streptomyces sp. NPDC001532 TaxID=3154520 RepID=UPI0033250792
MGRQVTRGATAVVLAAVLAVGVSGCSDGGDGGGSSAASKAASAAESAAGEVTAAASSLASEGSAALASATAEVRDQLDSIKGGVDAKDEVRLGSTSVTDDHATVTVTARNTADSQKSFAVQVDFKDQSGNLLDAVVVTVSDVAAQGSGTATARSTRSLSGEVKAEVGTALRY